ncbi:MAG: Sec-independent protein translocase protein TatB [Rhodobacteraceae bacterium]|nr:Sec-independent protein translocase protein TatB [Paracoccaceae bacterium]
MNLGMPELLVIGIVALIVIGPKDLPEMFRQLGRFTAKMRAMSREFSRAMEQAANETGVADVAKDLKAATNPKAMGLNAVKDAVDKFEKWDPIKNAAKPTIPLTPGGTLVPPPMPATVPAPSLGTAAAETTAAEAAPTAALGPNTAALYEKKAAKEAIVKEAAQKLRAIDKPDTATPAAVPAAKAKAPRAAKVAEKPAPAPAAPKAQRKKKAAEE